MILELQKEHQSKIQVLQEKHNIEIEQYQAKYKALLEQLEQQRSNRQKVSNVKK